METGWLSHSICDKYCRFYIFVTIFLSLIVYVYNNAPCVKKK